MTMTAAEHFEKAEYLLEKADEEWGNDKALTLATRAQAHLDAARLLFEVEHLPDDAHERLGGDAGQAPHRDALLHGVPEGEERDRREVRVSNRPVEALGVLDGIGSAHGGPHFLGLGLRFSVSPEA